MSSLNEILTQPGVRPQVIRDAETVIEEEVSSKGLAGLPIKAAYKVVKAVKPGFVPEVIDNLLGDFSTALDPLFQKAVESGEPIDRYLTQSAGDAAEALLTITDGRANNAKNPTIKTAYQKLRPTAKKHVEAAIPRVGRLIAKYAS